MVTLAPAPPIPATAVPYVAPRPIPVYSAAIHADDCPCNTCTKTPYYPGMHYPLPIHAGTCACWTCKRPMGPTHAATCRCVTCVPRAASVVPLAPRRDPEEPYRVPVSAYPEVGEHLSVIRGGGGFESKSLKWHDRLDPQGFIRTFDDVRKLWQWRKQPANHAPAATSPRGATVLPFKSSARTELGAIYDYETEGL